MFSLRRRNIFFVILFVFCIFLSACTDEQQGDSTPLPVVEDLTGDLEVHYTVIFDSMGGSSVSSQRCTYDSLLVKPTNPTKENYTFKGWFIDTLYSKEWNFDTDTVLSSITLYAKWQINVDLLVNENKLTFNRKAKSISYTLNSQINQLDLTNDFTVSDNNLYLLFDASDTDRSKPLFTSNVANFEDLSYGSNSFILVIMSNDLSKEIASYSLSIYRKSIFTIRFFGLEDEYLGSADVEERSAIPFPTYSPRGYFVSDWNCPGKNITKDGSDILATEDNMYFYASCSPVSYAVTLNANGGTVKSDSHVIIFGASYELPIPTKEGNIFNSWTTAEGVDLTGNNGVSYNVWNYVDVNCVYARWTPYKYTFTNTTEIIISDENNPGSYLTKTLDSALFSQKYEYNEKIKVSVTKAPDGKCSSSHTAFITDEKTYVQYCDCDIFGTVLDASGSTIQLSMHTDRTLSQDIIDISDDIGAFYAVFNANKNLSNYSLFVDKISDLFDQSYDPVSKGIYKKLKNGVLIDLISNSDYALADHYFVVSSPKESEKASYYELSNGTYTLTRDTRLLGSKTYYKKAGHNDFIEIISRLFGYDNADTFKRYSQFIATELKNNSANASVSNRLAYDGAIYTDNGCFIFPYVLKNDRGNNVLACAIADASGKMFLWISDIVTSMEISEIGKVNHEATYIEVVGRCMLFDPARIQDLDLLSISPDNFVYYVFCGWYSQNDTLLSKDLNYTIDNIRSDVSVKNVWTTITVKNVNNKIASTMDNCTVCVAPDDPQNTLSDAESVRRRYFGKLGETIVLTCKNNKNEMTFVNWTNASTTVPNTSYRLRASQSGSFVNCNWTAYTFTVVSAESTDWQMSINENIVSVNSTSTLPAIVTGNESRLQFEIILSCSDTASRTFYGWFSDESCISKVDFDSERMVYLGNHQTKFIFDIPATDSVIYLKWIDVPLVLNYSDYVGKADVTIDLQSNICGESYDISVRPKNGYFYSGIYSDDTYSSSLTEFVIPYASSDVCIDIEDSCPFTIMTNMPGAGKIEYTLTNRSKEAKTGVCSAFGKRASFSHGISYDDILILSATTFNKYVWMGWYYYHNDSWILMDTSKIFEVKNLSSNIIIRATWKAIETDISISTGNADAGDVSYYTVINKNGAQILELNTTINYGYVFDGWYAEGISYSIGNEIITDPFVSFTDNDNIYIRNANEKVLLSRSVNFSADLSEISGRYDLTTVEARFSSVRTSILHFYDGLTSYNDELFHSGEAGIIGYYINDSLHYEIIVKLASNDLSHYPNIGSFIAIKTSGQDENSSITPDNTSGLINTTGGQYQPKYDSENNTLSYLFKLSEINSSAAITLNYVAKQANTTGFPSNIFYNSSANPGTITVSGYGNSLIVRVKPGNGSVFGGWTIVDTGTGIGNNRPSVFSLTTTISGAGGKDYYATWENVNRDNVELFASVSDDQAASLEFYGEKFESGNKNKVYFSAVVNNGYSFKGWYDENDNLVSADKDFFITYADLATYLNNDNQRYIAIVTPIDSRIVFDSATEYSVIGYAGSDNKIYYNISARDSVDEETGVRYDGYYFLGWFGDITEEQPLYNTLCVDGIPEDQLPQKLYAKWSNEGVKELTLINLDEYGRGGNANYYYFLSDENLHVKLCVDIANGYRFNGWQTELDVNAAISSTLIEYTIPANEILESCTYYYSFELLSNDDESKNIELVTQLSSEIAANISTVADQKIVSYESGGRKIHVLDSGVKNGYLFTGWTFTGNDRLEIESDASISVYQPKITLLNYTSFVATAHYGIMPFSATNTSKTAGSIHYFGYYENENEINFAIQCTPNDSYSLWKIVSSTGETYYYDQNDSENVRWTIEGDTIRALFKHDKTEIVSYTVYWRSIWQTIPHYIDINECVNHVMVNATTFTEKRSYSTGLENYVQVYDLTASFDMTDYTFIGWFRDEVHDRNGSEITYEQFYCDKSSDPNHFTTDYPTETKRYFTKWGKYKINIETNDDSKVLSPTGYVSTITYKMDKSSSGAQAYISDIGVAYMDEYDETVIQNILDDGYDYLPLDMNKGEGGKMVFLVWKNVSIDTLPPSFVTKLSFSDLEAFTAKVLFADAKNLSYINSEADLNIGTGDEPILLYFSKDTAFGKPIEKIGLLMNEQNNGFNGEYLIVDADETKNLTPSSGVSDMYLTYKRGETALKIVMSNLNNDPDVYLVQAPEASTVAITNKMVYPDYYVNINYAPRGLIFAGWYDTPDYEGKPFDFSSTVYGDITLYPKWYILNDYDIDIDNVLSLNTTIRYNTNKGTYYFTALSDTTFTNNTPDSDTLYTLSFAFDNIDSSYTIIVSDLIDDKTVFTAQLFGRSQYTVSFPVTAGRLYRLYIQNVGVSNTMDIRLGGSLPVSGGSFINVIPFNEDVEIDSKPSVGQTFAGWFDSSNTEVGNKSSYTYYDDNDIEHEMYTVHQTSIVINKEDITSDIYRRAMYQTYTIQFGYRQSEASSMPYYAVSDSNGLVVGALVTLYVNNYSGFKFKEWLLYDDETGETYSFTDNIKFAGMISADDPKSQTFSFRMIEKSLIIIATWSIDDAGGRYNIDSFVEYRINYKNEYINSPDNRTNFYYKVNEDRPLSTENFYLNEPSRYEIIDDEMYVYSFEGWFYENRNSEQTSYIPLATNPDDNDKPYYFVINTAINYLVNGTVTVYAKWGQCIPTLKMYHDEIDDVDYIYLGEYPQSIVVKGDKEFDDITISVSDKGYYYNWSGTKKYYKYSDTVYFRVEKIRWDILFDKNGQMLIYSHSLLFNYNFNLTGNSINNVYANNWENSSLRYYLNNQFFENAFNTYEQNLIRLIQTSVDNSVKQGNASFEDGTRYPWSIQNNTNDYLFALSYKELSEVKYGFEEDPDIACKIRNADCSDYFRRIMQDNNVSEYYYWTRSPGNNGTNVYVVDKDGKLVLNDNVTNPWYGVRIAITVSSEQIYE